MIVENCEFKDGQFMAVNLSQQGAGSFNCFEGAVAGQDEVFFIDDISVACLTGTIHLLGQFVSEIESELRDPLAFVPDSVKRLCYPRDKRVLSYTQLTEADRESLKARLNSLGEKRPECRKKIIELLGFL